MKNQTLKVLKYLLEKCVVRTNRKKETNIDLRLQISSV